MNDRPLLHDSPRPDTALLAGSALLAWALFLLRFGYGFGYSDQDEFLPLAMRLLDGQLFARDAFVLMQLDGFTIRMPMAWLVALPSMVLPLWLTVFLLHMGTGIASGWAVARMANRLTDRWWIPPLATVAVIAITARWNPGGNDILHGMLVPSSVAWCALLWAFVRWQGQRYLSAGLLTALGTLFHPLVGLQAGGVLMLSLFFDREARTKDRIRMLLPWLVVAAATILLFSDLGSSGGEGAASATTILTHWRAPQYHLCWTFRGADALQLVLLVAGAGLLLWRGPGTPGKDQADLSKARLLLLIPVALLVASLTLTWWPFSLDSVLRLQPWALSPLIRVWSTLLLVVLAAGFIPRRTALKADKQRFSPAFLMLLVGGAALSLVLVRLTPDIRGAAHPDRELHAWAAENTDINAVFVVPPSMTGF
ncbi:MAG: hypothetical protein O2899_04940, partial [Bacteroidetes bacterium]|nr:hypothetical protein [Bacteroidota bacterium]